MSEGIRSRLTVVTLSAALIALFGASGCLVFEPPGVVVSTSFGDFNKKTIFTGNLGNASFTQPAYVRAGADGKLYVTTYTGLLFAFTLNADHEVVNVEQFNPLGSRMLSGLAFDPWAPPSDPVLYVTNCPAPIYQNADFTGQISRLSGPGWSNVEHVITGLPRSFENHLTMALLFGPDRSLYISQGGNTNYGSPAPGPFGNRPERELSAAILKAAVRDADFNGATDVEVYAPGMRNAYGMIMHTNGYMYVEDQGGNAGLGGRPDPSGSGAVIEVPNLQDKLHVVRGPGWYFGHPNPARGQLEFEEDLADGTPYSAPITLFPFSSIVTGIAEYHSPANGGLLLDALLLTGFGNGNDLHYVTLSGDGLGVADQGILTGGFDKPLDLTVGPDGAIYVIEVGAALGFGGIGPSKITVLEPIDAAVGEWGTRAALIVPRAEHAAVALNDKVYIVGGDTPSGVTNSLHLYDPKTNGWTPLATKPGTAVNHPAAAAVNGKLYVFGGLVQWPAPAVAEVWEYDPANSMWTEKTPMPRGRGAMGVAVADDKVYLFGGLAAGAAVKDVGVYDPAMDSWEDLSITHPMPTARDHFAAVAAPNGLLYAIGGRQVSIDSVVGTVEAFDPVERRWLTGYPNMPTARGGHAAGLMHGRIVVVGGEGANNPAGVFMQAQEFDPISNTWRALTNMPAGRHGTMAVVIDHTLFIPGGGGTEGGSTSNSMYSFAFMP